MAEPVFTVTTIPCEVCRAPVAAWPLIRLDERGGYYRSRCADHPLLIEEFIVDRAHAHASPKSDTDRST